MDPFLKKLEDIEKNYVELEEKLSNPEFIADQEAFRKAAKARHQLEPTVEAYRELVRVQNALHGAQEILRTETDRQIKEMAQEEITELEEKAGELGERLKILLLPVDPNDEKDIILEIRAGAGGDEASIFAGDLLRMYLKYADWQGWKPGR